MVDFSETISAYAIKLGIEMYTTNMFIGTIGQSRSWAFVRGSQNSIISNSLCPSTKCPSETKQLKSIFTNLVFMAKELIAWCANAALGNEYCTVYAKNDTRLAAKVIFGFLCFCMGKCSHNGFPLTY